MRNGLQVSLMFIVSVLPLLSYPLLVEPAEQKEIRVHFPPHHKSFVIAAEERFVDNGDGTITDTRRNIMWQKGDNGKEVTFEKAQEYCRTLRLGGYADWRLPKADERETAVVIELTMSMHSRDAHAYFDLYWSSDPTALLPFNYRPSQGKEVSRVYFARENTRAFVRAVRSLGTAKLDSGG
jgi:Protein of unknown function (DUF1566)